MPASDHDRSRRRLLRLAVAGAAALPLARLGLAGRASAQERLSEDDAQAQSLSYTHDASTVDHPAYREGSTCANCQLYQGEPGSEWGPCPIFGGRLVNANGWCTAWVKAGG